MKRACEYFFWRDFPEVLEDMFDGAEHIILKEESPYTFSVDVENKDGDVINYSMDDIAERWSPRYYDYGWQFDNLVKTLRSKGLDSFKKTIQTLLDTGKLDGEKYHPDVLQVLKDIL